MHRREEHNSLSELLSLYLRKNEFSSHYSTGSKSPPPSFHTRDSSTNSLEERESPPGFTERKEASLRLFERRESLSRLLERGKSPPHYLKRSRSHSPSPDPRTLKFESPPHYLAKSEFSIPPLETEENKNHYDDVQKHLDNDDHQVAVSMSVSSVHELKIYTPDFNKPQQPPKFLEQIKSLNDIDNMTVTKLVSIKLSGNYTKKIKALMETGVPFVEAKRSVIRQRFIQAVNDGQVVPEEDHARFPDNKFDKINSEAGTSQHSKPKKPRFADISKNIAVILDGYPEVQLMPDKLKIVKQAIMCAYESLENGPQVRFEKCEYRPGYLTLTCADKTSANWLKETVPLLKPWQDACLMTVKENRILQPVRCSVFVPDEDGKNLPTRRIFNRLQVGNKGLNCHLWTMLSSNRTEKGVMWTFTIDLKSLKVLEELNMRPYFGFGTLNFTLH